MFPFSEASTTFMSSFPALVCMVWGVSVCARVEARGRYWRFPSAILCSIALRQSISLNWKLAIFTCLPDQQALGIHVNLLWMLGLQEQAITSSFLHECLGFEHRHLCLQSKSSYLLKHLLSPLLCFKIATAESTELIFWAGLKPWLLPSVAFGPSCCEWELPKPPNCSGMDSGLSLLFCEVPHFSLLLKLELFRDHPSLMIAFSSFLWYYFMGILADHACISSDNFFSPHKLNFKWCRFFLHVYNSSSIFRRKICWKKWEFYISSLLKMFVCNKQKSWD